MTFRRSMLTIAVLTTAFGALTAPASASPTAAKSDPVYSYASAIRETVWVDTGLAAPTGGKVRVAADIVRPNAPVGTKVPVIMDASPYYTSLGRGNESQKKTYDSAGKPVQFPLFYDNYFVPRGYATVLVDLSGTARSNGCVDVGGNSEVTSAKAVIDWLNGRATGYGSATGSTTVSAGWSTGAVGMIGKSWDGTIANGVAATGVDGLKTIVPIGAISSWYDYYRSHGSVFTNGGPSSLASRVENAQGASNCGSVKTALNNGATSSGDLTSMWQARNYVPNASRVKASVFVVHGMNDLNVKTINFGQWWSALPSTVERKIWLSQTGHVDPFDFRRAEWVTTLHAWFDHYLLGLDNGVQNQPQATIERAPGVWAQAAAWPEPVTATTLYPKPGTVAGVGSLSTVSATGSASVTDNNSSEYTWANSPNSTSANRIVYSTGALANDVRVSGTGTITVTASSSSSAARVSAVLVDYGPATIRDYRGTGEGIRNLSTRSCWGESGTGDSACYLDTETKTTSVNQNIIARGWSDLGHYASLDSRRTLTSGTKYTITFNLASTDQVIPAGHRLAVIIGSTDSSFITTAGSSPRLTVDLSRTSARLPLVGSI